MTQKKVVSKAETIASKFYLTRMIMTMFSLGESGKLDSFFEKVVKQLTRDLEALRHNLKTRRMEFTHQMDLFKDKLIDANEALKNAYLKIEVEKIKTNSDQTDYIPIYLRNIGDKKRVISSIEKEIEELRKEFNLAKEDIQKEIKKREEDLETIKKEGE